MKTPCYYIVPVQQTRDWYQWANCTIDETDFILGLQGHLHRSTPLVIIVSSEYFGYTNPGKSPFYKWNGLISSTFNYRGNGRHFSDFATNGQNQHLATYANHIFVAHWKQNLKVVSTLIPWSNNFGKNWELEERFLFLVFELTCCRKECYAFIHKWEK